MQVNHETVDYLIAEYKTLDGIESVVTVVLLSNLPSLLLPYKSPLFVCPCILSTQRPATTWTLVSYNNDDIRWKILCPMEEKRNFVAFVPNALHFNDFTLKLALSLPSEEDRDKNGERRKRKALTDHISFISSQITH